MTTDAIYLTQLRHEQRILLARLPAELVDLARRELTTDAELPASALREDLELLLRERAESLRALHTHWISLVGDVSNAHVLADFTAAHFDAITARPEASHVATRADLAAEVADLALHASAVRGADAPPGVWLMVSYLVWADSVSGSVV